jgi:hypothetical protein
MFIHFLLLLRITIEAINGLLSREDKKKVPIAVVPGGMNFASLLKTNHHRH